MKLFSFQQSQDIKNQEQALVVSRIQELRELEKKALSNLSKTEEEFNRTLERNKKIWEAEMSAHSEWKKKSEAEVSALEERRRKALVPIEMIEAEVMKKNKVADERAKELIKDKRDNEQLKELLEDKLDEVGAREQDVLKREQAVVLKEEGLEASISLHKQDLSNLSEERKSFAKEQIEGKKALSEAGIALNLREKSLIARSSLLDSREKELHKKEIQVEDQRSILERERARMG